jgi:dehydrogenase/reductase SDR family member 1
MDAVTSTSSSSAVSRRSHGHNQRWQHLFVTTRRGGTHRRDAATPTQHQNHGLLEQDVSHKLPLKDCVCLVTGASRGIGKGIALELGRNGAIVYVTGTTTEQSTDDNIDADDDDAPGTIDETADLVTQLGGKGIAVRCDHAIDEDVQHLMDRISTEQGGRLDILVNNAFRLPSSGVEYLQKKFWEQGPDAWDPIHQVGLRSHYVATCYAMPLLFRARSRRPPGLPRPFIAMIGSFGGLSYTFNVAYGVGKAGVDRLAKDMAIELASEDICVVSLWPGVVDTERTQIAVETGDWDKYVGIPLDDAESPQFTGRAVVALAADPDNLQNKSGRYHVVAELAQEYGFTDITGKTPPSIRSLRFLLPSYAFDKEMRRKIPPSLIPDWKLPFWMMAQGRPPDKNNNKM